MKKYIIRKFTLFVISLFLVSTLTFFLMKSIPGDPFMQEQAVPEEILQSLHAYYGLDQPLDVQYIKYIKGLLTFDLGPSFIYEGRTTNDIIREGFPISSMLGLFALFIAITIGISLGSIAALFRTKWQDTTAMILAVMGMSIPSFIFATFLQYIFAMKLAILPIARWGTFSHIILPSLALAAFPTAFIARLTRANMVEVLEKDYVLTAYAKGLSTTKILFSHVLKNSLLPVISYLGTLSASILTGSFVVEKIFGIPGLGGWFVSSIANRDYTIIMGLTVFYCFLVNIANLISDLLYFFMDPRIRTEYRHRAHV